MNHSNDHLPEEERNPLDVLADEFAERLRAGEFPSIESYAVAYPELADEIRELFPSIEMIERLSANDHERLSGGFRKTIAGPVPTSLGDFDVVREIGRGGMGIVYEAIQRSLHRRVALKVLGPHVANSPKQLKRFQREAEAAARLHHSHIVPVFGIGESSGQHYFAMQYIEGVALSDAIRSIESSVSGTRHFHDVPTQSQMPADERSSDGRFTAGRAAVALVSGQLRDQLRQGTLQQLGPLATQIDSSSGSLDAPEAAQVAVEAGVGTVAPHITVSPQDEPQPASHPAAGQFRIERTYWLNVARATADIADALAYAHQHGVLHRDVKPANILLDDSGVVWITDFGLARHEEHEGVTETGDIVGTLRYMAPEQFSGQSDARSDIYSLGMTLYELLALRPAYDEVRHAPLIQKKTTAKLASPRTYNRQIPRDLETITMKACAEDPKDRYATAAEFAADLERFLEDRPIHARRFTSTERLWRWARRNPVIAALSTTSFGLLIAVAVVSVLGNYRTGLAMAKVEEERTHAVQSAEIAQAESERAEKNLRLAIRSFEEIIDNIASRGVPQSIEVDLEQDVAAPQPVSVLTAADANLLQRLLVFFDDFAAQNATDLKPETAEAHRRMGDIQLRLGKPGLALESYDEALAIYSALKPSEEDPQSAAARIVARACILNARGLALNQNGSFRGAIDSHQQARKLLEDSPPALATVDGKFELAHTLNLLGSMGPRSGFRGFPSFSSGNRGPSGRRRRPEEAGPSPTTTASTDQAIASIEEPGRRDDGVDRGNREVDRTRSDQSRSTRESNSDTDNDRTGRGRRDNDFRQRMAQMFEQVVASSDLAIGLLNELINSDPTNVEYRLAMARCLRNRVWIDLRNGPDVARGTLERSITLLQQLVDEKPANPRLRYELADTLCLRVGVPNPNEVDVKYAERVNTAIEICDGLLKAFPDYAEYQALTASALIRRGFLMRAAGEDAAADDDFNRAIDLQRTLASRFPTVAVHQLAFVRSMQGRGYYLRSAGNTEGARAAFGEAVATLKRYAEANPDDDGIQRMLEQTSRVWKELSITPGSKPNAT
ncbi:protein kinase [bacterium]|nr:protein kinase [bacterium]